MGAYAWPSGTTTSTTSSSHLVEPRHLLGARVGRCLPLSLLHTLALVMGTHGRLGAEPAEPAGGAVPAAVAGGSQR